MTALRKVLTPVAIIRAALAWVGVLALFFLHDLLTPPVPTPLLIVALIGIVGLILVAAFGVVHEAEELAHRLGDPYGSLVLTLSIVLIEVILISSVMLGPGEHATIARDSVSAVMMIILNLVIGVSLLVGTHRHGELRHNRTGTSTYLAMIAFLVVLAFAVPSVLEGGQYPVKQVIPVIVVTIAVYAWFLYRQMGPQAADYYEVDTRFPTAANAHDRAPVREILAEHKGEILARLGLLVVTMVPIVLMSHDMAVLLDDGLGRAGLPVALAGVLIAMIVFTPEGITAVRAAMNGEVQRVINLCQGAFVSTVGLTIPAVLTIGLVRGDAVILAESPAMLVLVLVTVATSAITFMAPRLTSSHGAVHVGLFLIYATTLLTS